MGKFIKKHYKNMELIKNVFSGRIFKRLMMIALREEADWPGERNYVKLHHGSPRERHTDQHNASTMPQSQ